MSDTDFLPLTKEERERLVSRIMLWPEELAWAKRDLLRYEVTVSTLEALSDAIHACCSSAEAEITSLTRDLVDANADIKRLRARLRCAQDDATFCDNRVSAAEAEAARLRPLAEVGEAVEEMAGHDWMLCPPGHIGNRLWTVLDGKTGDLIGEGDTPLAALRAAEEDADCTFRGVPSSQLGG